MRYRLLDILACPNDRHWPLELRSPEISAAAAFPKKCREHCGLNNGDPAEVASVETCGDCGVKDIRAGELFCPVCRADFPIIDGIPDMLPATLSERGGAQADKHSEIAARDHQAEEYDRLTMLKLLTRLEAPVVTRLLAAKPGDLVIELGAGTGRLTQRVAAQTGEVAAFDFSLESLLRSRTKHDPGNIHWVRSDINHLPLRAGVGDRAFSCQVFEHLPGVAFRNQAVDETARVLKDGGAFVISVYRDSKVWRMFGSKEGYHRGGIYYCRLTGEEFATMLSRSFQVVDYRANLGFYLQLAKGIKT